YAASTYSTLRRPKTAFRSRERPSEAPSPQRFPHLPHRLPRLVVSSFFPGNDPIPRIIFSKSPSSAREAAGRSARIIISGKSGPGSFMKPTAFANIPRSCLPVPLIQVHPIRLDALGQHVSEQHPRRRDAPLLRLRDQPLSDLPDILRRHH